MTGWPVAPALREQTGHAPQPWPASTRSATMICCSRLAWSAAAANCAPPKARHVEDVNWSPPKNPLPVLMFQLPLLSHWATRSHTESGAALAAGAAASSGAPATAPARAVRARVLPVVLGAR